MAMIQNEKEVHFTGMTRVQLEGNKIIATQNGEAQVTIAANSRSLTELADKISESAAKKGVLTDQEMLDNAVVESYRGYCTPYKPKGYKYWYSAGRFEMIDFIEFYLSANRLKYSVKQMHDILVGMPSEPDDRFDYNVGVCDTMSVTYLESKIRKAAVFAKDNGFTLPELKNTPKNENNVERKLTGLNWAG